MKKKIIVCILVLCSITLLSANNPKWYSDPVNQYGGFAGATYASSDDSLDLRNVHEIAMKLMGDDISNYVGQYKKLSKEDTFLIWSSLKEWNYSTGDIYNVVVAYNSGIVLLVTVRIKKNNSFDYVASCFRLGARR